jgi:hypothetical protein
MLVLWDLVDVLLAPKQTQARNVPRKMVHRKGVARVVSFFMYARAIYLSNHKRLSATDISAHASMKNVAKCDTWCELQNPVNHRVFERKLRPKPFGRGHVCLGVTHRIAPFMPCQLAGLLSGAEIGLPCPLRG